jgi:hypothetical protein
MEVSRSWEANSLSASQETLHILLNTQAHYCIHKCPTDTYSEPQVSSPVQSILFS